MLYRAGSWPTLGGMRWWLPTAGSLLGTMILTTMWVWLVADGPLSRWDRDLRARVPVAATPAVEGQSNQVIYLTIRDITDQAWPWPALDYAILSHSLIPLFPKVVVWDHLPPERPYQPHPTYMRQLQTQLDRLNELVVPISLYSSGPQQEPLPRGLFSVAMVGNLQAVPAYAVGRWPDDAYRDYPTGVLTFRKDSDRVVRRVPLVFQFRDRFLPSLALEAYCRHLGADWHYSGVVLGKHVLLRDADGTELARVPIDASGSLLLRPLAEPYETMEVYSLILASEQRRTGSTVSQDLGLFRNSLVVVGRNADGIHQGLATVLGTRSSGELTAHTLSQLVTRQWLSSMGAHELTLLTFLTTGVGGFLAVLRRWHLGNIALPAGILLLTAGLAWTASSFQIWISPLCLVPGWIGGWIIGWMWRDISPGTAPPRNPEGASPLWYRDQTELPF